MDNVIQNLNLPELFFSLVLSKKNNFQDCVLFNFKLDLSHKLAYTYFVALDIYILELLNTIIFSFSFIKEILIDVYVYFVRVL